MVFEQGREHLNDTYQKVARSFADRMDQYFRGFPELASKPEFVPEGCRAKLWWAAYQPPAGLDRSECAMCLIWGSFCARPGPRGGIRYR